MNRNEFLSRFDFAGYVFSRFSTVLDTSDEDRIRVICPMCDDNSGHLYILLSAGLPYCQKCKYNPKSPIRFIADIEGVNVSDVIGRCGEIFGKSESSVDELVGELFEEEEEDQYFEYEVIEFGHSYLPLFEETNIYPLDKAVSVAREYLLGRGMSREIIEAYDITYCYDGQYAGRVIVPCKYKGEFVTFVARDIFGSSSRKYLNPQGNKQSDFLFNLDSATGDSVILTEGVFDAINAAMVAPAVASFGKSLSERQLSLLNSFKTVIFYWDLDAYPQAEKYAKDLQCGCKVVLHSDGMDAGSRSLDENRNLIMSAVNFDSVDYEMFKLLKIKS